MKLPALIFCIIVGGFLVTGGTLLGSSITTTVGVVCWGIAAALFLTGLWHFITDAWADHQLRKRMQQLQKRRLR